MNGQIQLENRGNIIVIMRYRLIDVHIHHVPSVQLCVHWLKSLHSNKCSSKRIRDRTYVVVDNTDIQEK